MVKLRNLLALMTVVLHLAALFVPATAHAAMDHAAGSHGEMHAQADHHAQPDELCCASTGGDATHKSDSFCPICVATCFSMQATLEAVEPLPFVHSSASHLALAEQALRSAAPEAALKPPRTRS